MLRPGCLRSSISTKPSSSALTLSAGKRYYAVSIQPPKVWPGKPEARKFNERKTYLYNHFNALLNHASSSSQPAQYDSPWTDSRNYYYDEPRRGDYYRYNDFSDDRHSYTAYERQRRDYGGQEDRSYHRSQHRPHPHRPRDRPRRMHELSKTEHYSDKARDTYHREDRPVTPPPPRSPSPSYIKLAEEPPETQTSAMEQRKLLILDLNGTLVHRAPLPRNRTKPVPTALDDNGRPLPRLRPTHPRPYMPAFRAYLFAPATRSWLDVMIWSSAQPHSVQDMVEKCFGSEQENLLAIWARDTLGLSQDHYCTSIFSIAHILYRT